MPFQNPLRRYLNGHALRGMLLLGTANLLMVLAVSLLVWRSGAKPLSLSAIEFLAEPVVTVSQPMTPLNATPDSPQTPDASTATNSTPVAHRVSEAVSGESTDLPAAQTHYFNGRPLRPIKIQRMRVTAYSPDEKSCGKWADGVTASGFSVWTNGGKLVAADTRLLPFGSIITVPGYHDGKPVPVLDRGGRIKGHRLDVLYPTHQRAIKWGKQMLAVTFWEYADE